jgi:hypothetical protein
LLLLLLLLLLWSNRGQHQAPRLVLLILHVQEQAALACTQR